MKIRPFVAVAVAIAIGVVIAAFYRNSEQKTITRVSAQPANYCESFTSSTDSCGNNETCGLGTYTISAFTSSGSGINASEPRSVPCQGTSCGNVDGVQTAYLNNWCCDRDGDGVTSTSCGGNDCNDDPNNGGYHIKPSATEVCDGTDNNCANGIDEGFNQDNDGYKTCDGDCNDNNASINPGATEVCDEVDNNCDGITDVGNDLDGDQYTTNQGDCNDCDNTIYPGAPPAPNCPWNKDSDCDGITDDMECVHSPIVIDILGNGFDLTNLFNGVDFDLNSNGVSEHMSWTSAGSDDSWLVLDRNQNGLIDNGQELFGNFTPRPSPPAGEIRNGFLALAEYDKPENGGNGDRQIDSRDAAFSNLRLWRDSNHNGVSEMNELQNLANSPIRVIELRYRESNRVDEHGNQFKYRAKVRDVHGAQVGRWAWDVFLLRDNTGARSVFAGQKMFSLSKQPTCSR